MNFICQNCNKSFIGKNKDHKYKFCSHRCHSFYRVGKPTRRMEKIDRKGYWFIYMPDRIGCGKQGYFAEHRYVMEKHLGRSLRGLEQIHHINRNKKDNRIENLKLFASSSDHMKSEHYRIGSLKKGHTPWNKGTKGLSKPNSGSFVKGRLSHNKNGAFVSCAKCGEKIWTTPSTPRKFCSKECYLVSKKGFVFSVFL